MEKYLQKKKKTQCKTDCKVCRLEEQIAPQWQQLIGEETEKQYFRDIKAKLHSEDVFYPPAELVFNFTRFCRFQDIRVVILGQDPYHNPGQAMGLSFSVPVGQRVPPSLANIYKELKTDIAGFTIPSHGDLSGWARQGVLLLNDTLTVARNKPASHAEIGWKCFTKRVLETINSSLSNVVFLLWGNHARKSSGLINKTRHLVLEAGHPSPFSVKMFSGCRHFSRANEYLIVHSRGAIDWNISS